MAVEMQLREATAGEGDCRGRYPIDRVLDAQRGSGPNGANMVRVAWHGKDPATRMPWGDSWVRVSGASVDVRREAVELMGPNTRKRGRGQGAADTQAVRTKRQRHEQF